jgi:iron complex transport system substrate-binding protein
VIWATVALAGTWTDPSGRVVEARPDDTIVVMSGALTESVFALGWGDRVVGVDISSVYPASVSALPQLGYFRTMSAEGVLGLGPDLVIVPDDAGPPGVVDQIRSAGVRVAVLPSVTTIDGARARIRAMGTLLDRPAEAAARVEALDRALAAAPRPAVAPKVLFVYARGAGTLQVAGDGTAVEAMIELAGGENAVTGFEGYRPLTAEAVVTAAPDVILFTDRGLASVGGVDAVLGTPGVALTPAGAARRVVSLDDLLLLGFGPRTGEAVVALARLLGGR